MQHRARWARVLIGATALGLGWAFIPGGAATAIINGTKDGERHPNAGIMDSPNTWCSGVLISPSYFATAAHCVESALSGGHTASEITVRFDSDLTASTAPAHAVVDAFFDPRWKEPTNGGPKNGGTTHFAHDFGLLKLATPITGIAAANLPSLGSIDALPTGKPILETVGYGLTGWNNKEPIFPGYRAYAPVSISRGDYAAADRLLKISGKQTGPCFGDSGGPTYLGTGTSVVVGLMSGVTSLKCSAWGYISRLDTSEAHAFYAPYD